MKPLAPRPRVKLSRLRDIGWAHWDPIGLLGATERWDGEASRGFAGEYDSYLVSAASKLRDGATAAEVVDYLVAVEAEHMGLGQRPDTRARAEAVVAAIVADESLWTYPDQQGRFE